MAVYGRGVLVHCLCRLRAAVSVFAAELPCGNGVLAKWALEHGKPVHHFDRVMSHNFDCILLSQECVRTKVTLTMCDGDLTGPP